ncbi:MAG: hypothetical protein HY922_04230 [Elusimicrobia bacterium]|nr:hypothetical protein [Elusimicrobiota bacterium]
MRNSRSLWFAFGLALLSVYSAGLGASAQQKPKKAVVRNTVRRGFDRVIAYAKKRYPKSTLMGIDAVTDTSGSTVCVPPSDGWAYYFYQPRLRDFMVIYECEGDIAPGAKGHIPVDLKRHGALPAQFIDSGAAMAALSAATQLPRVRVSMKLLSHKTPPAAGSSLIWHIRVRRTWHMIDARDKKYLGTGGG